MSQAERPQPGVRLTRALQLVRWPLLGVLVLPLVLSFFTPTEAPGWLVAVLLLLGMSRAAQILGAAFRVRQQRKRILAAAAAIIAGTVIVAEMPYVAGGSSLAPALVALGFAAALLALIFFGEGHEWI